MGKNTHAERFWTKVDKTESGCWVWTSAFYQNGYGAFWLNGKSRLAHRVAYEMVAGPIPDGLQLDHLCRRQACVNPAHLEPVTAQVNTLRNSSPSAINARRVECIHGHPFDLANTYVYKGHRQCRTCRANRRPPSRSAEE